MPHAILTSVRNGLSLGVMKIAMVALLLLVGCGSTTSVPPATVPATAATSVEVSGAPQQIQHQGLVIDLGANAFTQPTRISLGSAEPAPVQPPNPSFHAIGSYFQVHLGAQANGEMTFTLPRASENAQIELLINGLFVPLRQQIRHPDGSLSGTLNFPSGANFRIGLVESDQRPVPHQNWGSWNGYLFRPAAKGQISPGAFEQIVFQGQLRSSGLPDLGDHPLVVVHGLGSSIQGKTFNALAQVLADQGAATSILGFEYDSLDQIQSNGAYLRQALQLFGQNARSPLQWNFVAHSMGTLVTRSAIEQPGPAGLPGPTGRAIFLCGPHLGSGVIDELQRRNLLGDLLSILTVHALMDFRNRDGQVCRVENREAGLDDLRTDSPFLAALNASAASRHPSTTYYTLAGRRRRSLLEQCAVIFRLQFDDGVVNIASANFPGLGQRRSQLLEADHLTVNVPRSQSQPEGDGDNTFPVVVEFLGEP